MKRIFKAAVVIGSVCFLLSCGSSPKSYSLDGSNLPGYSKNEYYGSIEFSRDDNLMHKVIDEMNFFYHNPDSYSSIKAEGLTSNVGVQTVLPFLMKPSLQKHAERDTLIQIKGVRGKDSLTFNVRKFKPDRPLTKIEILMQAGYYHEQEKLWAAPVYPDLEWFDCGKNGRNESFIIKPVSVFIEQWYAAEFDILKKVKDDAIKNSNLNVKLIDFDGCFKVIKSDRSEHNDVDAAKELPYVI
ncbi:hypothetical protein [Klebsiella aerogenes]|uniref:hypothetical protein n=1 Tax=Klebsiella aerogenes TaxID=548 RepID=UPI0029307C99|nr:hypothetical protein [Klebsiella aerogenes]